MQVQRKAAIGLAALVCASCASFGPDKLVSSHTAYNDAVQLTVAREVLSNIVRTRYSDPMQFMTVRMINAQFSINTDNSAGIGGIGQAGTAGEVGASVGYSDSPTITYAPESGASFFQALYTPLAIEQVIGFTLAGRFSQNDAHWRTLNFAMMFAAINGAADFTHGRQNPVYMGRLGALVKLLEAGATLQQVPEWDAANSSIPKERVFAEDMVDAFKLGIMWVEEDGGESARLARLRLVLALSLPSPNDPDTIAALRELGVEPGAKRYIFRPPSDALPGERDSRAIWVTPRSMSDVLFIAAQFVDVPEVHADIVQSVRALTLAGLAGPLLRIHTSERQPAFPYRVEHRGQWFYVDDADLRSKAVLEVLVTAYMTRIGAEPESGATPQLVLPVGGG